MLCFCLTTRAFPGSNRTFISIFIIYIIYKSPSSIIQSLLPQNNVHSRLEQVLIRGFLGFLTDTTVTPSFIFHSFPQTSLNCGSSIGFCEYILLACALQYKFSVCHCQAFFKKILIEVPSTCRESAIAPYGVVVSILETTTLEEHRKIYRQIQDRSLLHHLGAIGQHDSFCVLICGKQIINSAMNPIIPAGLDLYRDNG